MTQRHSDLRSPQAREPRLLGFGLPATRPRFCESELHFAATAICCGLSARAYSGPAPRRISLHACVGGRRDLCGRGSLALVLPLIQGLDPLWRSLGQRPQQLPSTPGRDLELFCLPRRSGESGLCSSAPRPRQHLTRMYTSDHTKRSVQTAAQPDPVAGGGARPPPPPSRTDWTRLVPPPVLNGHALSQGAARAPWERGAPLSAPGA